MDERIFKNTYLIDENKERLELFKQLRTWAIFGVIIDILAFWVMINNSAAPQNMGIIVAIVWTLAMIGWIQGQIQITKNDIKLKEKYLKPLEEAKEALKKY
jgi:amino acid transporter